MDKTEGIASTWHEAKKELIRYDHKMLEQVYINVMEDTICQSIIKYNGKTMLMFGLLNKRDLTLELIQKAVPATLSYTYLTGIGNIKGIVYHECDDPYLHHAQMDFYTATMVENV